MRSAIGCAPSAVAAPNLSASDLFWLNLDFANTCVIAISKPTIPSNLSFKKFAGASDIRHAASPLVRVSIILVKRPTAANLALRWWWNVILPCTWVIPPKNGCVEN